MAVRGRPKGVEAAKIMERRMRVLALRRDGNSLAAIGAALETSTAIVTGDVKWLREQGYDLGEARKGASPNPATGHVGQLRAVAAADDEAVVRREVNDRRIRGQAILEIAIEMRIPASEVRRHLSEAARLARESDDIEQRRELELSRLDRLLAKLAEGIDDGDPKSISAATKVIAERCRIQGLYRPMQIEHTVITVDMIDAEMARLTAQLGQLRDVIIEGEAVEATRALP